MWCGLNRNSLLQSWWINSDSTCVLTCRTNDGDCPGGIICAVPLLLYCTTAIDGWHVPIPDVSGKHPQRLKAKWQIKLSAAHVLAVINYLKQKSTIFLDHHNDCENVTDGLERQMPVCMCVVVDEQTWYSMFWYVFHSMHQQSLQCVGTLMGSDQTKPEEDMVIRWCGRASEPKHVT